MTASRIKMIYMSGTGNTAWVARRLAVHLTAQGYHVERASCEAVTPAEFDVESADMLGVLSPVWGSWAPAPLGEA